MSAVAATTVTAATMAKTATVKTTTVVKTAPVKAAAVVETAPDPKPDPDANGNCVAISPIIGVIRFGISVVGRLIIGLRVGIIGIWVGRISIAIVSVTLLWIILRCISSGWYVVRRGKAGQLLTI
jgi:hypothetical protein